MKGSQNFIIYAVYFTQYCESVFFSMPSPVLQVRKKRSIRYATSNAVLHVTAPILYIVLNLSVSVSWLPCCRDCHLLKYTA